MSDGTTPLPDGGTGTGDGSTLIGADDGGGGSARGDSAAGFDVEPSTLQTLTVTLGQTIPTAIFKATDNGQPVSAGWSVDRGNLASITGRSVLATGR